MCGIVGSISAHTPTAEKIQAVAKARDELQHRGPDSDGLWVSENVVLGFRRLSIIDLSTDANQPMERKDLGLAIVFNGEIYNYLELKQELETHGALFHTKSDTEVILVAYSVWGIDCFSKFNGMFALAIYDCNKGTILFARDRFGKKPLYYTLNHEGLFFASEVKALRTLTSIETTLSPTSLCSFFIFGYVPHFIGAYNGVKQIAPSQWKEFDVRSCCELRQGVYWQPSYTSTNCNTYDEAKERLQHLVSDAVSIRLRSDVPIAAFLSGGIDSTLVAGFSSRHSNLTAVTIGFSGWTRSEHELASLTANALGLNHIVEIADQPLIDETLLLHFDEPYSDWSLFATAKVCELARPIATVLLSGDGGDEAYAGYESHIRSYRFRHLRILPKPIRKMIGVVGSLLPPSTTARFLERIGEHWSLFGIGGLFSTPNINWWNCLSPEIRKAFLSHVYPKLLSYLEDNVKAEPRSLRESQEYSLQLFLTDDVLTKVDRMSMYHSVEVRSPLLDYRIFDFGLNLRPTWKTDGKMGKSILRDLAGQFTPQSVVNAPKRGFGAPIEAWLKAEGVNKRITEVFHDTSLISNAISIDKFLSMQGIERWPHIAFRAYVLGIWLTSGRVTI